VARWRRPGANELLLVFLLLSAIGFLCSWLSQSHIDRSPLWWSFLITAFLAWRVSRGGRISRMILILGNGAACARAVLDVARLWDVAVVALAVVSAVQVALLVSPPVYGRTRPAPVQVRAQSWRQLLPPRPPAWLLPWGLLAGVLVTLAYLGSMDFITIAGCRPATSDACSAFAEGYPLRWLSADQGTPLIFKDALLRDSVQWALCCTSVVYLAWVSLMPTADLWASWHTNAAESSGRGTIPDGFPASRCE
jgi:hypothetical protein